MWNKQYELVENVGTTLSTVMLAPMLGLDVEATSLDQRTGTLLTVQIATPDRCFVYDARRLDLGELFRTLEHYIGTIIIQNAKFDLQYIFANYGTWLYDRKFFDPFLAHRLKNMGYAKKKGEKFVGLDRLCKGYLDYVINKDIRESFQFVTGDLTDDQLYYAAEDAAILIPLYEKMLPALQERQPRRIIEMEMSLLPVTGSMEFYGVHIDHHKWMGIAEEKELLIQDWREKFQAAFESYGWGDINPNSPKQLKEAFLEVGVKLPDTEAKTIIKFKSKAPHLFGPLIEYKKYRQATTTFGRKWLRHADKNSNVYASFNQLGTDTGRYSCSTPNLQNIPVRDDVRYREAFIARNGYQIIAADLSQIEYRIAGEFSNELSIIQEYNKVDPDFHQLAADRAGEAMGQVIARATGKTMNFALLYQAGPGKLVDVMGCDMGTAKRLHKAYWEGFSNLQRYMKRTGYEARVRGYAETYLGRKRYFSTPPGAPNWMIKAIEREGGNMPIQGTAADILKQATLLMFEPFLQSGARLIHQVHDEVVVEVPNEHIEETVDVIRESFKRAGSEMLDLVPVITNIDVNSCWSK